MKIAATQYTLQNYSLEIYVSGCKGPHCKDCHNPELWDFSNGDSIDSIKSVIKRKLKDFDSMIKSIMIFGGDLLDNPKDEIIELLEFLQTFNKDIWLFTRYDIDSIDINIRDRLDYIKCGRYLQELKCEKNEWYGINLATSNQRIYKKGKDY